MDWVEQLSKMNEEVEKRNQHNKEKRKRQSVQIISNNGLWKCIGFIILPVTFGNKLHKNLGVIPSRDSCNGTCLISRDVCRNTDLLKVSFTLNSLHYSLLFH